MIYTDSSGSIIVIRRLFGGDHCPEAFSGLLCKNRDTKVSAENEKP